MPSLDKGELGEYFDQLIEATRNRRIDWAPANPTTFLWETQTPKRARLTLQRLERQELKGPSAGKPPQIVKNTSYIFQATEIASSGQPTLRYSVNTSEDVSLSGPLEALYETIRTAISQQSLDFLRSILPPNK